MVSPLAILDYCRSQALVNAPWEVLVQWQGLSPDEASWEDWAQLRDNYHLENKVVFSTKAQGVIGKQKQGTQHREQQTTSTRPKQQKT